MKGRNWCEKEMVVACYFVECADIERMFPK